MFRRQICKRGLSQLNPRSDSLTGNPVLRQSAIAVSFPQSRYWVTFLVSGVKWAIVRQEIELPP